MSFFFFFFPPPGFSLVFGSEEQDLISHICVSPPAPLNIADKWQVRMNMDGGSVHSNPAKPKFFLA